MRILIRDQFFDLELIKVDDIWIEDDIFLCFYVPEEFDHYCRVNLITSNYCEKVLKLIMVDGYYNLSNDIINYKVIECD